MSNYPETKKSSWIWDSFQEPRTIPQGWDLSHQDDPGDTESHQYGIQDLGSDEAESER